MLRRGRERGLETLAALPCALGMSISGRLVIYWRLVYFSISENVALARLIVNNPSSLDFAPSY